MTTWDSVVGVVGVVGHLAALLLVLAAVGLMVGLPGAGRLVVWVVIGLVAVHVLPMAMIAAWNAATPVVTDLTVEVKTPDLTWILVPVLVGCFLVAVVRFVSRRRQLRTWIGTRKTSLKERVERE